MTQQELDRLTKKWRKKLRLNAPAWESIKFEFKPRDEMKDGDGHNVGWCNWMPEERKAWGEIMEEADLVESGGRSVEATLVHELLHIVFQGHFDVLPKYDPHFERALNDMTDLLVPEKKNGKKTTKQRRSTEN
jgi:hypothetical protein